MLLKITAEHTTVIIFFLGNAANANVMCNLRPVSNFLHSKTNLLSRFSIKFYLRISFYDINMDFGIFGSKIALLLQILQVNAICIRTKAVHSLKWNDFDLILQIFKDFHLECV